MIFICAKMRGMKQILYIIRHGHTSGTESELLYGSTDLAVTEDGFREIEAYAEEGIYPDTEGAAVWTSGMLRTEQTLKAMYGKLYDNLPHRHEPRLREIDLGKYEMKTVREAMQDEYGKAWLTGELDELDFEGGDSESSFKERVNNGLWHLLNKAHEEGHDRIIAVLHGAVITYIMDAAFPGVHDNKWAWCPNPGTGYRLVIEDGVPVSWELVGNTGENATPVK